MDLGLKSKTVVVTGGSSGIGLATVRSFLSEGANVAFCARGADRLAAVSASLAAEFGETRVCSRAFSVLDEDAVNSFADDSFVKKVVCLTDAMSPVPGFEKLATDFIDDMKARGMKVSTTTDYLKV